MKRILAIAAIILAGLGTPVASAAPLPQKPHNDWCDGCGWDNHWGNDWNGYGPWYPGKYVQVCATGPWRYVTVCF